MSIQSVSSIDLHRFANPSTCLGSSSYAWQRPANPMGDESAWEALGVGMLKVTTPWSWRLPAYKASGGAGPLDLVLCAIGSVGGREGEMITLGGVATASANVRRRGATGAVRGDRTGIWMTGLGDMEMVLVSGGVLGGDGTLGGGWSCTLGGAGFCRRAGVVGGGGMRRCASKIS